VPVAVKSGQTEITHLHRAISGNETVARLDIPVQHAGFMGRFQTTDQLQRDLDGLAHGQWAFAFETVLERAAMHQLHRDHRHALDLFAPVDVNHVGMIHGRGQPSFAQETLAILIRTQRMAHDFQGHAAFRLDVGGFENLSHPTLAEQPQNLVATEPLTWNWKSPAGRSGGVAGFGVEGWALAFEQTLRTQPSRGICWKRISATGTKSNCFHKHIRTVLVHRLLKKAKRKVTDLCKSAAKH
jgi:hypothetical protein